MRPSAKGHRGARTPKLVFRLMNGPVLAFVRLFHGRILRIAGRPVLPLSTVGAWSGRQHTVPLLWFAAGVDRWLVVASSGGMAAHPAWYFNLLKNPDRVWIEVGGRRRRVAPEVLVGEEREQAWSTIKAMASVYRSYEQKTDREIPVIRLAPAEEVVRT